MSPGLGKNKVYKTVGIVKINNSFLIFFCLNNKIQLCEIWESKQYFHAFLHLNTLKRCNLAVFQLFDCIQDGGGPGREGRGCIASHLGVCR